MHNNIPTDTPWGSPQHVRCLSAGIFVFQTATHGGIWLDSEKNALIPDELKGKTFQKQGYEGWYEQDCDAKIVIDFFSLSL